MQLLHVKLRALAHPAPQNRTALLMNLKHVAFRFLARITEHPLKNHRHVGHQIHGIVVHHDQPRKIELFFRPRLRFDRGPLNRCRAGLAGSKLLLALPMPTPCPVGPKIVATQRPRRGSPNSYAEKANIRRLRFKPRRL